MNLENKIFYKVKNPRNKFICALCSSPRQMKYSRHLSPKNYIQITLLGVSLTYFLFPYFHTKTLFLTFVLWMIAEVANKMLYRAELPCPYCGFDATWYRRDVKVARKRVEDFFATQKPIAEDEGEEVAAQVNDISSANQEQTYQAQP